MCVIAAATRMRTKYLRIHILEISDHCRIQPTRYKFQKLQFHSRSYYYHQCDVYKNDKQTKVSHCGQNKSNDRLQMTSSKKTLTMMFLFLDRRSMLYSRLRR